MGLLSAPPHPADTNPITYSSFRRSQNSKIKSMEAKMPPAVKIKMNSSTVYVANPDFKIKSKNSKMHRLKKVNIWQSEI